MFSRVFVAALVALPMIASATPTPNHPSGGECNIGEAHCCEHAQQLPGNSVPTANGLLGLPINVPAILGVSCSPTTVLGVGGTDCNAQTVCCKKEALNALFNLFSCSPVNVNL